MVTSNTTNPDVRSRSSALKPHLTLARQHRLEQLTRLQSASGSRAVSMYLIWRCVLAWQWPVHAWTMNHTPSSLESSSSVRWADQAKWSYRYPG